MRRLAPFILAVAFLLAPAITAPAQSRMLCGPPVAVMAHLEGRYGERVTEKRPIPAGTWMVARNIKTGTWTIIILTKKGAACVLAVGRYKRPAVVGKDV